MYNAPAIGLGRYGSISLNPKRRYMVVPNDREAEVTIKKQMSQLVQLNEGQPYTYDREALIKMLDEALAGSRPRTK